MEQVTGKEDTSGDTSALSPSRENRVAKDREKREVTISVRGNG